MKHEKYRAAPLNVLGSGRRERKLGVVGPVGETHKQLSQRRGSVRAETSDAADPGGARVSRGGCRSHPQQHPPRPTFLPQGVSGAASLQLPRASVRTATHRKFALQRPSCGEFGVSCAHTPRERGQGPWSAPRGAGGAGKECMSPRTCCCPQCPRYLTSDGNKGPPRQPLLPHRPLVRS